VLVEAFDQDNRDLSCHASGEGCDSLSLLRLPHAHGRSMSTTTQIEVPAGGAKIVAGDRTPDNPIIPFIEGDGIVSISPPAMQAVVDAAREGLWRHRQIRWMEIYAGEKATRLYGHDVWLPDETLEAARETSVSIKGADDHPGRRRHPLAQRCAAAAARPLRLPAPCAVNFPGVPSPLKDPSKRTWSSSARTPRTSTRGSNGRPSRPARAKVIDFLQDEMGVREDPLPETSSIGIKPVSRQGTDAARAQGDPVRDRETRRESVTLGHKATS